MNRYLALARLQASCPEFRTARAAAMFAGGYIPERVTVRIRGRFYLTTRATAAKHGLRVIASNKA